MPDDTKTIMLCGFDMDTCERISQEFLSSLEKREELRKKAAEIVFNSYLACDFENPQLEVVSYHPLKLRNASAENLDINIQASLNSHTIAYFVEYVLANAQQAKQSAAALKRHAENHAMKQEVFTWLDVNRNQFKSMDATAEAISSKVAPITFRTARDWVGQWKKIRSAGTP